MSQRSVEIRDGIKPRLDGACQPVETAKAVNFVAVGEPRRDEGSAQNGERFVVSLDRYRKRMAVLAAVREGKAGGIGKTNRGAMNDLRHKGQRLQCAPTETFD